MGLSRSNIFIFTIISFLYFVLPSQLNAAAPPAGGSWSLHNTCGSCSTTAAGNCDSHVSRIENRGAQLLAQCKLEWPRCWLDIRNVETPWVNYKGETYTAQTVSCSVFHQGGNQAPDPCSPHKWVNGMGADDPGSCGVSDELGNLGGDECSSVEDSVDIASGNMNYEEPLIDAPGLPRVALNFNSLSSRWSSSVSDRIISPHADEYRNEDVKPITSDWRWIRGDGKFVPYKKSVGNPDIAHSVTPGYPDLQRVGEGFLIRDKQVEYRFSSDGRLDSMQSADGRFAIEKASGGFSLKKKDQEVARLYVDSSDRLTKVKYGNHQIVLNYRSETSKLSTLYVNGTLKKQYRYGVARNSMLLSRVVGARRDTIMDWTYDGKGRVTEVYRPGSSDRYTFQYLPSTDYQVSAPGAWSGVYTGVDPVVVTNPEGLQTTYYTVNKGGRIVVLGADGHQAANCAARSRNTLVDERGLPVGSVDWQGNINKFKHNQRGLETERVEAWGSSEERTITTEWHPEFNLPIRIEGPSQVREMEYNSAGQLIESTVRPKP